MIAYTIRRLLLIIPTFILVTMIVFLSVRFIPGDVVDLMVAEMSMQIGLGADETAARLAETLGLNVPIQIQYGRWLGILPQESGEFAGLFQFEFGNSLWKNLPVLDEFIDRLPVSLEVGIIAIVIGLILSVPIGVYSAIRQDTVTDYAGRTLAIICISAPGFWIATMVMVYPSIWWGWTPALKYVPLVVDPGSNLLQFLLPGSIMGLIMLGSVMRITRTMMLEVLRQDYIRTAWSKGLNERTVIVRHALKNALIPVITIIGMMVPMMIGGTVIIEQIFVLPGVGRYMFEAISRRDYPVVSGVNVFLATTILVVNLVVDLTYAWLDPRIRYH